MKNRKKQFKKLPSLLLIISFLFSFTATKADALSAEASGSLRASYQSSASDEIEVRSRLKELFFGKSENKNSDKTLYLYPGGDAFGVKICHKGVTVSKILTESAKNSFKINDIILKINDSDISSVEDIRALLSAVSPAPVTVTVERGGKRMAFTAEAEDIGGEYRLGVALSEGTSGIGTVTYYDPKNGSFGGLGHGITEAGSDRILTMKSGEITGVILAGAIKGEIGKPGELRGVLTNKVIGSLYSSTECGVFGRLSQDIISQSNGRTALPVASRGEVRCGDATIITTVKNGVRAEYTIKIEDINRDSTGTKSFRIKVTDETLIALTGGIVRGMSGSPIIQDGKLVGAVTHVLVADPTEGYGIFIENMLNASQEARNELPKAA